MKRRQFTSSKAASCDAASGGGLGQADIDVKHLSVQLPNTSADSRDKYRRCVLSLSSCRCSFVCVLFRKSVLFQQFFLLESRFTPTGIVLEN